MDNKLLPILLLLTTLALPTSTQISAESTTQLSIPNITFKGDFLLRHQTEKKESTIKRVRKRIRFRLGGHSKVAQDTTVKFGLTTGGTDPRSTNQTMEDSFQTPDIRLDYAFVAHHLTDSLVLLGGKMKNQLWRPSDLLWDTDINPDGFGFNYKKENTNVQWGLTGGYYTLDELKPTTEDPALIVLQPSLVWTVNKDTCAKAALTYYRSQHAKNTTLAHSAQTNTLGPSGLDDEFSVLTVSFQLDLNDRFNIPLFSPFGEVVINTTKSNSNKGAVVGFKVGDTNLNGFGKWQSKISFRYLAKDAWFDSFPNSDAYGGATNAKGLELAFTYGLTQRTTLGIDIYNMDKISGTSDKQTVVQFDLNLKF